MKRKTITKIALSMLAVGCFGAAAAPNPPKAPSDIVAEAPANAWRDIPADDLVVVHLANHTSFAIQLAPEFAPVHIANIKKLVRAGWFNDSAIVRVQDNYVVQWGNGDDAVLPTGVHASPPAEYEWPLVRSAFKALPFRDAYARQAGHSNSWPMATDGRASWLVHCFGMIGVGRNLAPDTGHGGELYTVIGHAPRHLDRNITLVGRIVYGIENLTALPRGTEALGFYKEESQRIQFDSVNIAADLPQGERPQYQVMDTNSASFAQWINARANRGGPFFIRPSGSVDICNAQAPIRVRP